ncbi:lysozyme [Qipengyuania mesophila]|uniref:lysozyme n=1 Tax=Qipengyuania mesophila TaxID=2867246 RepID=UPI0035143836
MATDFARTGDQPDRPGQSPARADTSSETLKSILAELNRPLDDVEWSASPQRTKDESPQSCFSRLNRERRHRRELRRARKAASQAFGVRPKLSNRRRATLMLGAGALGLTAFTGPPKARKPSTDGIAQLVVDQVDVARMPAALLKASDSFKRTLLEEEGVRYTVYRDVAGYKTVGVGHLVRPEDGLEVGDRVSERQMREFLASDLTEAERGVRRLVGDLPLHQHEFDALLDLVYNVGFGNVAESESPRLNAAIAEGDYEAIAAELDYTHAGGRFARGLMHRSDRRERIFTNAAYGDPREAGKSPDNSA